MFAQVIAQVDGGAAEGGGGDFGLVGVFFGDDIAVESIAAESAADVQEFGGRAEGFEMAGGAEGFGAAMGIVNDEREGSDQESGGGRGKKTTGGHFRHVSTKYGQNRADQSR